MRNPFSSSAGYKFASQDEILKLARETAARMAARNTEVQRVLLFGSFARGDFSARSDMDLLIVLRSAKKSIPDRIEEFLKDCSAYPTDVFPLTEQELRARLKENDPFWTQALKDAIQCYPADRV